MSSTLWLDGEAQALPSALGRGLAYGDGVFRTLLCWEGQVQDLDGQAAHLAADAERLGLEAPAAALWASDSERARAGRASGVLRWSLLCRAAGRGYRSESRAAVRLVQWAPLPTYAPECWQQGVVLGVGSLRLGRQPRLAGLKHLNRLEQVLAAGDMAEGEVEHLLCDSEGLLVSGTRSNVFWVRDGRLYTPDLTQCGVAGRMRRRILDMMSIAGLGPAEICAAGPEALIGADEIFLSNSLIGVWPVARLQERGYPAPGPVTIRVQQVLGHPWWGQACAV